nr:FtsW/RodA/SpoVE family cell cycle protein [Alkaliphilus metalliredigens]
MNKNINEFLNMVCKQIKFKGVHNNINEELRCHIDELADGYMESGIEEEKAIDKAIEQMGDPIEIGKELNNTHKPKTEWLIISLIATMVLIGGIALFSITTDKASSLSYELFFKSYIMYTLIGVSVFAACYYTDYTKLEKYSQHVFIGTMVFLFFSARSSIYVDGAPYVRIGGSSFAFAPVSIALPLLIIAFAGLVNRWATGSIKDMAKLLGLASSAAVLTLIVQPSLASALLLTGGFLVLITIAIIGKNFKGNKKAFICSIYGGGTLALTLLLIKYVSPYSYRLNRLRVFLNPKLDPEGYGYVNTLLSRLMSDAKIWGSSDSLYFIQQGVSRIALPEANTDFIFAYIVAAFGWAVGIITIMVIVLTIFRMLSATRKINHQYGRLLASSIVAVFTLQSLANLLMNTGKFPLMGYTLPFISYGGTNFITNMALVGFLLGIYRRKDLVMIKHNHSRA